MGIYFYLSFLFYHNRSALSRKKYEQLFCGKIKIRKIPTAAGYAANFGRIKMSLHICVYRLISSLDMFDNPTTSAYEIDNFIDMSGGLSNIVYFSGILSVGSRFKIRRRSALPPRADSTAAGGYTWRPVHCGRAHRF